MPELVAGLFAPAAAAGGAAAAGTAGAAAGLFGSSGALSILEGVTGVFGALSAIGRGQAQSTAYKMQAQQAEFDAGQEQVAGVQRESKLKRELLKTLGQNDVAFAASGIDIGTGIAADARQNAEQRASDEISIDRDTVDARIAMQRAKALGYLNLASDASSAGLFDALGIAGKTGLRLAGRG